MAVHLHSIRSMAGSPRWHDWITPAMFRIRVLPAAREKLTELPVPAQQRLHGMLEEIAELADLMSPTTDRAWNVGAVRPLLHLSLGTVSVRYTISEENRTLTVEHVVIPEDRDDLEPTG